jgi:hypothetical protein
MKNGYLIELKLIDDSWMAKHEDPVVKALFGCDWIPTAFRSTMTGDTVVEIIQNLNPERNVKLVKEDFWDG